MDSHLFCHNPPCPVGTAASFPVVENNFPGVLVYCGYMQGIDQTASPAEDKILSQQLRDLL